MSIGVGIFLMVVGAVLAFAVQDSWDAVNLQVVGYILLLAGLAGILLSFYITNRRRRVDTDAIDPAVEEEYRVVEEHHRDIQE
jgi:membrane protein implicated in regulation of membrane protease activity